MDPQKRTQTIIPTVYPRIIFDLHTGGIDIGKMASRTIGKFTT
jgi:hypothetical protein